MCLFFSSVVVSVATLLVTTFLTSSLSAQSLWLDPSHERTIWLEVLKPVFEGDDNTTFTSSAFFFTLRLPIGKNVLFVGELPLAHAGIESGFGSDRSENAIGNPYFGLQTGGEAAPYFGEFGVRAPIASEEDASASFIGIFSDIDREEAFIPDLLLITGILNHRYQARSGFLVRLRGGIHVWIPTESGGDSEAWLVYSGQAGYASEQFSIEGGFTGRYSLTAGTGDFGGRTLHQFGFVARIGLGNVRPGVHMRLPLDQDLSDVLDFVFGLNVAIELQ